MQSAIAPAKSNLANFYTMNRVPTDIETLYGPQSYEFGFGLTNMGLLYAQLGKFAQAERCSCEHWRLSGTRWAASIPNLQTAS